MPQNGPGGEAALQERRDLLAALPFLRSAPPAVLREFQMEGTLVRIPPGGYFLREGDECKQFALVVSGRLRVFKLGDGGQEITLYHVGPGQACPLNVSCLLSDRPVPAMALAVDDVEAIVFSAEWFRRWMGEYEPLRSFVFRMFSERLVEVMSLVEEVAFRRMDQRIAGYLDDLFALEEHAGGSADVTHAKIASDLGTAREVVSRVLKEFERLGAIELARGRIDLRKGAILRSLAGRDAD
jgi:CRP/FNR family transcriptional regulator